MNISKVREDPNLSVPYILMASYTYYYTDKQILTDACFDECCRIFEDNYDMIEHPHKNLIDRGPPVHVWLKENEYPSIVKGAVHEYFK